MNYFILGTTLPVVPDDVGSPTVQPGEVVQMGEIAGVGRSEAIAQRQQSLREGASPGQVTSVSQWRDLSPLGWAQQALPPLH